MQNSLLQLTLLLLLLLLPCMAWRNPWQSCNNKKPKCKSDRFDVVFDKYDRDHCKVYKCECRKPEMVDCSKGKATLKTDKHSCKYYDCIVCPQQTACPGSKVSKYKGEDSNGCAVHQCQCDPHPRRPACGADERLQTGTDTSDCPYYFCQQVRAACPKKPSCSQNQETVRSGKIGHCPIFKCECLTPAQPLCEFGTQPRLQDDGLGCQIYRCVANRSPCPAAAACTSMYQLVASNGVDANNCPRYECRCMPLAELDCPTGYRRALATDSGSGCDYYRCEPACAEKPNCTSIFEHAAVTATLSNGCAAYSCQCKRPEIINCIASNAHLTLTKAPDGSNCDIYTCESDDTRSCPRPTCQSPMPTVRRDSQDCTVYSCANCPPIPDCVNAGEQLLRAGRDQAGCVRYICYSPTCPKPDTCSDAQLAVVVRYAGTCPVFDCVANDVCSPAPRCASRYHLALPIGFLSNDCPDYICQPSGCAVPSPCDIGQQANLRIDMNACVSVECRGTGRRSGNSTNSSDNNGDSTDRSNDNSDKTSCPQEPICPSDTRLVPNSRDAANCTLYICQPIVRVDCKSDEAIEQFRQAKCASNEEVLVTGHDAIGCPLLACKPTCPSAPACSADQQLTYIDIRNGCAVFRCIRSAPTCPPQPQCQSTEEVTRVGRNDTTQCERYTCCSRKPTCISGFTVTETGLDAAGCSLYNCIAENSRAGSDYWQRHQKKKQQQQQQNRKKISHKSCQDPPDCPSGTQLTLTHYKAHEKCKNFTCCALPPSCEQGAWISVARIQPDGCAVFECRGGGMRAADTTTTEATTTTTTTTTTAAPTAAPRSGACPARKQCEYQQFSVRYDEWHSGQKCDMFSCLNLGDYAGQPRKCQDNPDFCEISQTVETFVDDRQHCQRIACRSAMSFDKYEFF